MGGVCTSKNDKKKPEKNPNFKTVVSGNKSSRY
jgi:hypothetical protein